MRIKTFRPPALQEAASSSSSQANLLPPAASEEDASSICCDIYIEGDDPSAHGKDFKADVRGKLAVSAVLRGAGTPPPPQSPPPPPRRRTCGCLKVTIIVLATLAALAVVIGVSLGVVKALQGRHAGTASEPRAGAPLPAVVTISVPFEASVRVPPPGRRSRRWSCDLLFRDSRAREQFATQLAAAHLQQLQGQHIDEFVLRQLHCNNKSYPLAVNQKQPSFLLDAAAAVAPAGRRLQQQQPAAAEQPAHRLAVPATSTAGADASSSSSSSKPLVVFVKLEARRREQLRVVPPVASYVPWIRTTSASAAAAAQALVPQVLQRLYGLGADIGCETLAVRQLVVEVVSAQRVDAATAAAAAGSSMHKGSLKVGSTLVIKTMVDPLSGSTMDAQTMVLPSEGDGKPRTPPSRPRPQHRPQTKPRPQPRPQPQPQPQQPDSSSHGVTEEEQEQQEEVDEVLQPPTAGEHKGCRGLCRLPNALGVCVQGGCEIDECMPGWHDCDGVPDNGCEAEVLRFFTDNNHCGSCNRVCLAPLGCHAGECRMAHRPAPRLPDDEEEDEEQQGGRALVMAQGGEEDEEEQHEVPLPHQPEEQQPEEPRPAEPQEQEPQQPRPAPEGEAEEQKEQPAHHAEEEEEEEEQRPETEQPGSVAPTPPLPPPTQPEQPLKKQPGSTTEEEVPQVPAVVPAEPPQLPAKPTKPTRPEPPKAKPHHKPAEAYVELRDDVARITPDTPDIVLDVLANDDLKGVTPQGLKLTIVSQPAAGTVAVLPADGSAGGARPRLSYRQDKKQPLGAGDEVEVFYSVTIPGRAAPGAGERAHHRRCRPEDAALSNTCRPAEEAGSAAAEVAGAPVPGLGRADDAAAAVPLPFPVALYGGSYSSVLVSSNGWLALGGEDAGGAEPCSNEGAWPNATCLGTGPVLAPFWDDLVPDQVLTHHDTQLNAFIIQWTNVMFPASSLPLGTFQAFIFENGTLGFVYRDLYGTDRALGTSAVVGIRGPVASTQGEAFVTKLGSTAFKEAGAGADAFSTWLFSAALEREAASSDFVTTAGAHRRFLSPGLALISHPAGPAQTPGPLAPWHTAGGAVSNGEGRPLPLPLLVSPDAPPRPTLSAAVSAVAPLQQQHAAAATEAGGPRGTHRRDASSSSAVAAVTWEVPPSAQAHSDHHGATGFKLFLSADPSFNELLRQPDGAAFTPDLPGSSRSAEIVLTQRHVAKQVFGLLLACNPVACSRSCVAPISLAAVPGAGAA